MSPIRVVVVDDEPPARRRIRQLLESETDVLVGGEARNADEAVAMIVAESPDVVFLDVAMPDGDGFSVLSRLTTLPPAVIFVTAFDDHAVDAFELDALDFLVKPVTRKRFANTMGRVRRLLARVPQPGSQPQEGIIRIAEGRGTHMDRIAIRTGDRIRLVEVESIDFIKASRTYAHLHTGPTIHVLRESLERLEQRLDPDRFVRIHRSTIVNVSRVTELESHRHGDYALRLRDGHRLALSRTYRERLRGRFGPEF